jgi:hypothetical protein
LLAGCTDEHWGSFQNGNEDRDELLQENSIYWPSRVMLEIVTKLTCSLDFEFDIYSGRALLARCSRGFSTAQILSRHPPRKQPTKLWRTQSLRNDVNIVGRHGCGIRYGATFTYPSSCDAILLRKRSEP